MTEIKLLSEHIEDELEDARTYIKLALEYKETDQEMAQLFYKLSGEEMGHMDALHKCVVSHIENYKRTNGDPPAGMKALYDFMHAREVEKAEKIVALQNMYKR